MSKVDYEISQQLHAYLASRGEPPWRTDWLSRRLAAFDKRAFEILGALEQMGWTYDEIYWLYLKNRAWRYQPEHLFRLQSALQDAGCPSELAKRLLIEPPVIEIQSAERAAASMRTMLKFGWREPQLRYVTLRKPRILNLPPKTLQRWHENLVSEGKDPIFFLHTLNQSIRTEVESMNTNSSTRLEIMPESTKISSARTPCAVSHSTPVLVPKKESRSEYVPEDRNEANWPVFAKQILSTIVPGWNDRKWTRWFNKNKWITELCQRTKNLDQILRWVTFPNKNQKIPHNNRSRLIASILLNRNLLPEDQKRNSGRSSMPRADLSSLLEIPELVLYLRFYVLRRVLEREPMNRPELLCLPFEQIQAKTPAPAANLSIPPPSMTGQDASETTLAEMQNRLNEIRFRANTIRGKGKVPWLKPYINMLLEPTQEKFNLRLNRYLEKQRLFSLF